MVHSAAEPHNGDQPISEQVATYAAFSSLYKWASLVIGALVLFLTLWFCTGAGFVSSAIVFVIVMSLGVFVLTRKKPPA